MIKLEPNDSFAEEVSSFCFLPFHKIILTATGAVQMCCHQGKALGTVKDGELLDIWRGETSEAIRAETLKGNLHDVCSCRSTCPFINKERIPYKTLMARKASYPIVLEICLPSSHCNIGGTKPNDKNPACIMCRRNFIKVNSVDIVKVLCEKARPIMPHIRQLMVLGTAEPFWKDATFEIFELTEFYRYKHRCQFHTNTNAICLTDPVLERFFREVEFSELDFSIDAASPMTFRKIRRLNVYDTVIKHIRRFIEMRVKHGGRERHKAVIYNNINLLNVDEMSRMVEVAAELGVDGMKMVPTYTIDHSVKLGELLLCEKNVDIFKECSEQAMATAQRLGVQLVYPVRFDVPLADAAFA